MVLWRDRTRLQSCATSSTLRLKISMWMIRRSSTTYVIMQASLLQDARSSYAIPGRIADLRQFQHHETDQIVVRTYRYLQKWSLPYHWTHGGYASWTSIVEIVQKGSTEQKRLQSDVNMAAADELANQLRLRDMVESSLSIISIWQNHVKPTETFRAHFKAMTNDRAQTQHLAIE